MLRYNTITYGKINNTHHTPLHKYSIRVNTLVIPTPNEEISSLVVYYTLLESFENLYESFQDLGPLSTLGYKLMRPLLLLHF